MAIKGLPGGRYRIDVAENEQLCAAVGATPAANGTAHPIFYYVATQAAMGVTVGELCEMCDFDVNDGPMMGETRVEFGDELKVGVDYEITGQLISLVRKASRTFGEIDLLTYSLTMHCDGGRIAAHCVNQWVLPRRTRVAA